MTLKFKSITFLQTPLPTNLETVAMTESANVLEFQSFELIAAGVTLFHDYLVMDLRRFVVEANCIQKQFDVPDVMNITYMHCKGIQPGRNLLPECGNDALLYTEAHGVETVILRPEVVHTPIAFGFHGKLASEAMEAEDISSSTSSNMDTVMPSNSTTTIGVEVLDGGWISDGLESTFAGLKKKKKPVEASILNEESGDMGDDLDDLPGEDEDGEGVLQQHRYPWEGTDHDYEYEELLGRVFHILRENNPELAGDRRRTVMRPPQVLREGTKKTVFVNLMDLCKTMHRQPDHVVAFLLAELGTSGSLDGQQRLVVKGRFAPKNFEGILRRYINEYVICLGCKSPDTILSKENRLLFLRCEKCGSGRSVAPIKAGFVARVGRRKAGT